MTRQIAKIEIITTAKYTSKISGCSAELYESEYNGVTTYGATLRRNRRAKKSEYIRGQRDAAERDNMVRRYMTRNDEQWVAQENAKRERNEMRKAERENAEQTFAVGDAIYNSWGYDQTNVDFYQIVRRTDSYVWLKPMTSNMVTSGPNYTGTVAPGTVIDDAKAERHKINVWNNRERSINFRHGGGYKYEDRPIGFTAYN